MNKGHIDEANENSHNAAKGEMDRNLLSAVNSPADIKALGEEELALLSAEIREHIIDVVAQNGGHLAPSLGVVELTLGIHRALNCPDDKLVWDVGHQCYAHKLITGRREEFKTMRLQGGISGFPKRSESVYDVHDAGHASSSIGIALGLAKARDLKKQDHKVLAVIGDGSLSGGVAFEALNQAGHTPTDLVIVLNDNEHSIAQNVGAISSYLSQVRMDPTYNRIRSWMDDMVKKIPRFGETVFGIERHIRDSVKQIFVPGMLFEELGFKYFGPIDGHDVSAVENSIKLAVHNGGRVLIHALTEKGRGYVFAEKDKEKFHGIGAFNKANGHTSKTVSIPSYMEVFGDTITELAEKNDKIVAITAAMRSGTGLTKFAQMFPDRFFDVGIAEQEALTFATGLALGGLRPVVAVYSTFLQRAYDQVIQDICLEDQPVVLAIDRAGIVGEDGPTHHGVFDVSYLRAIPNMVIMAPRDEDMLRHMLSSAFEYECPVAVRYPRGAGLGVEISEELKHIELGTGEVLRQGRQVAIIAIGRMVEKSLQAAELLKEKGIEPTLVDARFIKPLPEDLLLKIAASHDLLVTVEENALQGGFGSAVVELLADKNIEKEVHRLGIPDLFMEHGKTDEVLEKAGLSAEGIAWNIESSLKSAARTAGAITSS